MVEREVNVREFVDYSDGNDGTLEMNVSFQEVCGCYEEKLLVGTRLGAE